MAHAAYRRALEARKRASTAQLLFKCARLLNEQALSRIRDRTGHHELRASHTALLPHLDFEGVRPTDLAERLGVTKQAVGQLVDDLVVAGVVERIADPSDGRARLVRFSERGKRSLFEGLAVLGELEAELSRRIGKQRFTALHEALTRLLPVLEEAAVALRRAKPAP